MINSKIYIYIYLDKECITEHDDFGAIFLLRNVLWTAPVGLHYHESRGLPPRDSFFFNWDSLHARLNSLYKAWSYKKKEHKKFKAYRKSL